MSIKEEFINAIIEIEGGYVDDPLDSGGKTNWGITEHVARANGYQGHMRDMPRELAFSIYSSQYWDSIRLTDIEELSPLIAGELADTGVNQGTGRAAEFLQRSLNVLNDRQNHYADLIVDKSIGNKTLSALRAYLKRRGKRGEVVLFNMLNCLQGAFYVTLAERREKDERFMFGWFDHRVGLSKTGVPLPDNQGQPESVIALTDEKETGMIKKIVLGQLRHLLGSGGAGLTGWLLANGAAASDVEVIVSAVIALVSAAWSIWDKRQADKEIRVAAATGKVSS